MKGDIKNIRINPNRIEGAIENIGFVITDNDATSVTYKRRFKNGEEVLQTVDIYATIDKSDVCICAYESDEEDNLRDSFSLTPDEQLLFAIKALQLRNLWCDSKNAFEIEYKECNTNDLYCNR